MIKPLFILLFVGLSLGEICPDHYECPGSTCCLLLNGIYGCCPYINAVCCPDKIHCCSENEKCNVKAQKCESKLEALPYNWLLRTGFGAGRMFKTFRAPIMEDRLPSLMELNTIDGSMIQPIEKNKNEIKNTISDVIRCPDGRICKIGDSCCRKETGGFGCCPYVNASCCSDMIHCCPQGYRCDVDDNMCTLVEFKEETFPQRQLDEIESKNKTLVLSKIKNAEYFTELHENVCPNGQDECADATTCCINKSRGYGCCPYPNAVCCSDEINCCPNNYLCDMLNDVCVHNFRNIFELTIPFISFDESTSVQNTELTKSSDIVCPNGKDDCNEGETCCQTDDKKYGCCPYADAVCCTDGKHCCPSGYTCDLEDSECIMNSGSFMRLAIPFTSLDNASNNKNKLTTLLSHRYNEEFVEQENTPCPDGNHCADNATCCQMESGGYGCCPYAGGVCCKDLQHCCPHGTTCELKSAKCIHNTKGGRLSVIKPTREQKEYSMLQTSYNQMACQDGTNCADKSTCCKTKAGNYGCCPYENGSCCPDGIHCCPFGSKCDDVKRQCIHNSLSNFLRVKESESRMYNTIVEKFEVPLDVERTHLPEKWDPMHMCPDKTDWCGKHDTCCKLADGNYACCGTKGGVCCDEYSCCPEGTICIATGCAFPQQNVTINFVTMSRIPYH